MNGFNWEEIKKALQKAVKIDKNDDKMTILITILQDNIGENQMMGNMLKGADEMKRSLMQYLGKKDLDCDISINNEEKNVIIKLREREDFIQVHELLRDMFFGNYFKKMVEALIGAFGGMYGKDENTFP